MAKRLALAEAEEILRRQIEIGDDEIPIERNDGNPEPAEDALGARGPADGWSSGRCDRCG
jgi:hypothetical protein